MKKTLTFIFLLTSVIISSQEIKEIKWDDLIPRNLDFEDPFLELTENQLYNLKYVYRTRLLLKSKPQSVGEKTKTKTDSLEQQLINEGVDIDFLIAQKNIIKEKRQKKAESVVTNLHGKKIKLAGFLLPLEVSRKAVNEFLFVPYVGACIHQPSPPKNQIIYFEYPEGYQVESRYDAAWVEGELLVKDSKTTLKLVDGSDEIESGYFLKVSSIKPYYE